MSARSGFSAMRARANLRQCGRAGGWMGGRQPYMWVGGALARKRNGKRGIVGGWVGKRERKQTTVQHSLLKRQHAGPNLSCGRVLTRQSKLRPPPPPQLPPTHTHHPQQYPPHHTVKPRPAPTSSPLPELRQLGHNGLGPRVQGGRDEEIAIPLVHLGPGRTAMGALWGAGVCERWECTLCADSTLRPGLHGTCARMPLPTHPPPLAATHQRPGWQ